MSDPEKMLEFLHLVGNLKHLKRTGWVDNKVENPETVSGHMYRMAIMTLLINEDDNLDKMKCMELSLVHDLAECIVGDLTPYSGVSKKEKHRQEDIAMKELCTLVGEQGNHIYQLYTEYEGHQTQEAQFVKELDSLDMVIQAYEYEKDQNMMGKLQSFFNSTKDKFNHPLTTSLVAQLNEKRQLLLNPTKQT